MTTVPVTAVRQALVDTEAALARLRPALAAAYGTAGENFTAAATALNKAEQRANLAHASRRAKAAQLDDIKHALLDTGVIQEGDPYSHADLADLIRQTMTDRAHGEQGDASAVHLANSAAHAWQQDAERFKADHQAACETIADMHEAATGRTGMGPIRGVVEDVADVRTRAEQAEKALAEAERRIGILEAVDAGRAHGAQRIMDERDQAQERLDKHRRALAAIFARPAETPLDELTEYAAKTLTRGGERLLDAEERRAAAEKARAEAEKALAEAERVAERATNTLLRIKHARTAADAWTELGTHYHLSSTEAGRRARDWRSTAERDATARAETASVLGARYMGNAERYQAAWQNARLRAKQAKAREEKANERAERYRDTRRRWLEIADAATEREGDRARRAGLRAAEAEAAVARVRALLGTHLGPLATAAVRRALDTLEG